MNSQDLTPKTFKDIQSQYKPEDMEELKELRFEIQYFESLYKKESFDNNRIDASKLTNEIITNLKSLLSKKIKEYEQRHT